MRNEIPSSVLSRLDMTLEHEGPQALGYRLKSNGLYIILCPNANSSVVCVNQLIRVGSRNEGTGITGATHFLEHMMFKGTKKYNPKNGNGILDIYKQIGASWNATTYFDRTNYYGIALPGYLELLIDVESDRLRNLELSEEGRNSEMSVVRNELERGENEPGEALDKAVRGVAYREHPVKVDTIGARTDVEYVPMEKLRQFYDDYYWPNNTVLIITGNFDPQNALELAYSYYGQIPSSPKPIPTMYTVEPKQEGERRVIVRRAGDLERVQVSFHIPEALHEDTHTLAVISAILGDSSRKASRLYKRLIDKGLAISGGCRNHQFIDPSLFDIRAEAAPDKTAKRLEKAILKELKKLATVAVTPKELARAQKAIRTQQALHVTDPGTLMWLLNESVSAANLGWFESYCSRIDEVTSEKILKVAKTYFTEDNRTVGYFIPKESPETDDSQDDASTAKSQAATSKDGLPLKVTNLKRIVLDNGLKLLVIPQPGTGVVSLRINLPNVGGFYSPVYNPSIASTTAAMLTRGTKGLSKAKLAEKLEELGDISLNFRVGIFSGGLSSTTVVASDFPKLVDLTRRVLRQPLFSDSELNKFKQQAIGQYVGMRKETQVLSRIALSKGLYPEEHPNSMMDIEETIHDTAKLTSEALKNFHNEHYGPDSTIFAIVGDITVEDALSLVKANFGDWKGKPAKENRMPPVKARENAIRQDIFIADKSSADIIIGHTVDLDVHSTDYFAARIANAALGENTMDSRLGQRVRVELGLTYGIYSYFEDLEYGGGSWSISLTVNPENIEKSLPNIADVVTEYIQNGISDKELEGEIKRAVGEYLVSLDSSEALAGEIAYLERIGCGAEAVDAFAEQMRSVTKDQVNAAIKKYFALDRAVTVVAGTLPNR